MAARVSLVFDGGRAEHLAAARLLTELGKPATFLLEPSACAPWLVDWREVSASGHEIGVHPFYHLVDADGLLIDVSDAVLEAEVGESIEFIRLLGREPRVIGLPLIRPADSVAGRLFADGVQRFNQGRLDGITQRFEIVRGPKHTEMGGCSMQTREAGIAYEGDAVLVYSGFPSSVFELADLESVLRSGAEIVGLRDLLR